MELDGLLRLLAIGGGRGGRVVMRGEGKIVEEEDEDDARIDAEA